MYKKIIALFSTVIIIFNVIFPSIVRAADAQGDPRAGAYGEATKASDMQIKDKDSLMTTVDGGSSKVGNGTASYNVPDDSASSLVKNLVKFLNIFPSFMRLVLTILTYDENQSAEDAIRKIIFY